MNPSLNDHAFKLTYRFVISIDLGSEPEAEFVDDVIEVSDISQDCNTIMTPKVEYVDIAGLSLMQLYGRPMSYPESDAAQGYTFSSRRIKR